MAYTSEASGSSSLRNAPLSTVGDLVIRDADIEGNRVNSSGFKIHEGGVVVAVLRQVGEGTCQIGVIFAFQSRKRGRVFLYADVFARPDRPRFEYRSLPVRRILASYSIYGSLKV